MPQSRRTFLATVLGAPAIVRAQARTTLKLIPQADLAVADPAGARGGEDGLHGALHHPILADDLDLHLREEVHDVLGAAIQLRMAFLAAEALGFHHRDPLQTYLVQRLLHFVQLERLDHRFDLLHACRAGRLSPASSLAA